GKLTYGHAGVGTPSHLSAELFKSVAGVNIQPVPYRGIPSLLPDLLAGRVTMTLPNMSVVLPLVREGKLRALMAMAPARPAALPDVPTLTEAGFTGFDTTVWFGLMAPSGTPQPIIDKLYSETARVLVQNDARKHLQDLGMEIVANTPSEFAARIKSEILQWAKLIKDAGISVKTNRTSPPRLAACAPRAAMSSPASNAASRRTIFCAPPARPTTWTARRPAPRCSARW